MRKILAVLNEKRRGLIYSTKYMDRREHRDSVKALGGGSRDSYTDGVLCRWSTIPDYSVGLVQI